MCSAFSAPLRAVSSGRWRHMRRAKRESWQVRSGCGLAQRMCAARGRRCDRWSEVAALAGGGQPETGVDMGFSVQARLGKGGVFSGHYSLEGEYQNRLLIVGRSGSVIIERVFTPPADHRMEWRQRVRNAE